MSILYLLARAFSSPLETLYVFLIFIIAKDWEASPLQLTVLACCKPSVSLISAYANRFILGKPKAVKPFLLTCYFAGLLPCLFFPFVQSNWFFIFSYACFMASIRASYPAWIEVLRSNLTIQQLAKTTATGSSINYFILTLFPLLFTYFLDKDPAIWRTLFVGMGLLQFLFCLILLAAGVKGTIVAEHHSTNILKEGWLLLKSDTAFLKFQSLFFLGGAGLVAIQPILPIYFNETLHLSYTELALAFSFCRGIAFICSSPFWVASTHKLSIYGLNGVVNALSTLFIAFILTAGLGNEWLWIAYIFYGAMQAGFELCWNISGPLFSKEKESTLYSSINLFFVSIRGMIFPFLGQLIFSMAGSLAVFYFAGGLCLLSVFYALLLNRDPIKIFNNTH